MTDPIGSRHELAEESPGFLLWRITLAWQKMLNQVLRPLDLTHPQFVVLASVVYMLQKSEYPTQVRLASHAAMDVMTVSKIVRTLEQKDLITRTEDPSDTRAKLLNITQKGKQLAVSAIERVENADGLFFETLGKVNQPIFLSLLQVLSKNIKNID
jgi:MarR family transcriptional regulator, organic hydroperoxide resistance regulator